MRPAANITLHAILAACLVAFAATSAAAAPEQRTGKEQIYYTITLTNASAQQGSKGEQLEIQSFHWGPRQSTSADGSRTRAGNQISLDDTPGGSAIGGAVGNYANDGDDAASGQATGKRQHKPMVMRGYYDQSAPPPNGSLTVLASGAPCRVGARYPALSLGGGGKRYVLQDVVITSCGAASAGPEEQITFVYGKVTVRGWNPETKQR